MVYFIVRSAGRMVVVFQCPVGWSDDGCISLSSRPVVCGLFHCSVGGRMVVVFQCPVGRSDDGCISMSSWRLVVVYFNVRSDGRWWFISMSGRRLDGGLCQCPVGRRLVVYFNVRSNGRMVVVFRFPVGRTDGGCISMSGRLSVGGSFQ